MLKEIIFNSARATGDPNAPVFTLRQPVYAYALKVQSVCLPFSYYSFGSNNNVLAFTESGTPGTTRYATIPRGNYDASTILNALGTAMSNAGTQTYTVTYNDSQETLSVSAPSAFTVLGGNAGSTAANALGSWWTSNSGSGTSLTFPHTVNFNGSSSLLLCSNHLASENVIYSSQENTNVLCNIPTSAPSGSVIFYENLGGYLLCENTIQTVDFLLLDSATGLQVDLNGSPFVVVLSILTSPDDMTKVV